MESLSQILNPLLAVVRSELALARVTAVQGVGVKRSRSRIVINHFEVSSKLLNLVIKLLILIILVRRLHLGGGGLRLDWTCAGPWILSRSGILLIRLLR